MKKNLFLGISSTAILALVPLVGLAIQNPGLPDANINSISNVGSLICAVAGWMFYFLILLAVIFVFVAAYGYLTAAGDPEKVKAASNRLIYAAVAVAVGILAKSIPIIVSQFFGVTVGTC